MKKLLAVLLVAFIALGAVFADDPAGIKTNPDSIVLKYVVKTNDNVLLRNYRFRVNGAAYTGTPVVVSEGEGAEGGILLGDATITVIDASKKTAAVAEQTTYITLGLPTGWVGSSGTYCTFTDENLTGSTVSTTGVTVTFDDDNNKITITYADNAEIDRTETTVDIANWKIKWDAATSAPAGEYLATIPVTISAT